jgi:carbonic anhydrase
MRIVRDSVWAGFLSLLLIISQAAAGFCQASKAASAPPACVPPFDIQRPATPKAAFNTLMAGNARYVSGAAVRPNQCPWGAAQTPFAAVLSCSDARVSPEILFDTGNNQLFIIRVAGNTAGDPDPERHIPLNMQNSLMFQSLEYSFNVLGVKLILVLGHTNCGAVAGAVRNCPGGRQPAIFQNICPAINQPPDPVTANVVEQVNLLKRTPPFKGALNAGTLAIVGGVYNIATGRVTVVTPTP